MNGVQVSAIPLGEFAKMLHEAQAALENNDIGTALKISERISQVGYSLVVRNGGLCLENQTKDKAAPESAYSYTARER